MYRYRVEHLKREEAHPRLFEEHDEIIRCLEARDKEKVTAIVGAHITNQVDTVTGVIRTNKNHG